MRLLLLALLCACGAAAPLPAPVQAPAAPPAPQAAPAPRLAQLAGCDVFGADSEWNRDVAADAVDAASTEYLQALGASDRLLHPDFGVAPYGIPINVVSSAQPAVPMSFLYASQSDPGPYPFPQDVKLQSNDDRHAVVVDADRCKLYETYATVADGQGGFHADSGAVWDLHSSALRPDGWTSATASGLPLAAGLVRYDEAAAGEIRHALAFFVSPTAHAYVHPATHSSGTSSATYAPPLGLRVRLRTDFDLTRFHGAARTVLVAMQRYGMFLIDNANLPYWSVQGEQDPRWDMADLDQLKSVPASAFEVLKIGALR